MSEQQEKEYYQIKIKPNNNINFKFGGLNYSLYLCIMIKCTDKGIFTCISRNGIPKKSYDTDSAAIAAAKIVNQKDTKQNTKLVAYKCSHCQKYHLLTKKIKLC